MELQILKLYRNTKMKYFKYIILTTLSILFISCETEVSIDLKTAKPRLVIDAAITEMQPCIVKLKMTQDYWDKEPPEMKSGAIITLKDNNGNMETLVETVEGTYVSQLLGVPKEIYTLTINVDGEVYEAKEYLPPVVPIEKIRIYKIDAGSDYHYYPCISYNDPKGVDNYYLYRLAINSKMMQNTRYEDDKNSDGKFREPILAFDKDENGKEELKAGDHVKVEMQSVSKGSYRFYETIQSPGGSQNSNPVSNFSGNVLGLFKAYTSSIAEMTIAEEDLQ